MPENRLRDQILEKRDELLSEVMENLNDIVCCLKDNHIIKESRHRMADFAELLPKIHNVLYDKSFDEQYIDKLLNGIDTERRGFLLEDDQFFDLLNIWITQKDSDGNYVNTNRKVKARDLYKEFKVINEQSGNPFDFESTKSMSKHLRNILSDLRTIFDIKEYSKNGVFIYYFKKK